MPGTVTVACKLPSTGMFLDIMGPERLETRPNGEEIAIRETLKRVFVKGAAEARRLDHGDNDGNPIPHEGVASVVGGYGLTHGVDAEDWAAWHEQNKTSPLVKNNIIFAQSKPESARDKARDQAEVKSIDPLDPTNPGPGIARFKPN